MTQCICPMECSFIKYVELEHDKREASRMLIDAGSGSNAVLPMFSTSIVDRDFAATYSLMAAEGDQTLDRLNANLLQMAFYGCCRFFSSLLTLVSEFVKESRSGGDKGFSVIVHSGRLEKPTNREYSDLLIHDSPSICFELLLWFCLSSVRVPSSQDELAQSTRRLEAAIKMVPGLYDSKRAMNFFGYRTTTDLLTVDFCHYCASIWGRYKGARICLARYLSTVFEGQNVLYYPTTNAEAKELDASWQAQLTLTMRGLGMKEIFCLKTYAPEIAEFKKETTLRTEAVDFLQRYKDTEDDFKQKFPRVSFELARVTRTKLLDNLKENDFKHLCLYSACMAGYIYKGFSSPIKALPKPTRDEIISLCARLIAIRVNETKRQSFSKNVAT
eukprot:GHVP01025850.1.p1 GENE.GHVP01025850.1~~GHVP01025850.1.p1  ORF type:complete len:387 (+),score=35.79 GHVP01025850.1:408-1568(+)